MRLATPTALHIRLLKDDNFSKLMRVSKEIMTANRKLKENKENLNGS